MKSIVKWAISNSPAMNTFLIAALIVGSVSMVVMRREVFPNFALEVVLVQVPFPGATPDEVEEGICQKIESAINGVEGIKKVTSIAAENSGSVVLELNSNVKDVQRVLNDVRSEIDQIANQLPPTAEDAEVKQIVFRNSAITLGITGPPRPTDVDHLQADLDLRAVTEEIRSDLLNLEATLPASLLRAGLARLYQPQGKAISSAEIVNEQPYEVSIEVSEDKLREYGLNLSSFADVVRNQNVNVPGGKMETVSQELLLRGNNKRETGTEIAQLAVITKPNGSIVTVGDIANVVDGFEETTSLNLIDGKPGLVIEVSKTDDEDLFTVVDTVKEYVATKQLPPGYSIQLWGDVSIDVTDRIDLLSRNGTQGLILVFVVLAIFLELRLAFWVAMGIPICVLGAGFILLMTGQTLNMLSMFAFLMALGIVVDDAIVVGENIFMKRQEGMTPFNAAVAGTVEVLPSVTASVTTTVIAFMPLMYVSGVMGKFIAVMPVAVIAMLIISLFESMFILPAHLAHENNLFLRVTGIALYIFKPLLWVFEWVNRKAATGLNFVIERLYQPLLGFCLVNKPIVLATLFTSAALVAGSFLAGWIKVQPFPRMDGRQAIATVAFPDGTSASFARNSSARLRDAAVEISREIEEETGDKIVDVVHEEVGQSGNALRGPTGISRGSHVCSVNVHMIPPGERTVTVRQFLDRWREKVNKIPGAEALKFDARSMGPGGSAIEFKLLANDDSTKFLESAAEECKQYLATKAGVVDIEDDSRQGKWELHLNLNEQGKALGIQESTLAQTIRAVYFGDEVMRVQRGRHEVKIMVRYPRDDRKDMESFEEIRIRDNMANERPISDVATADFKRQLAQINRLNSQRSISVTADVKKEEANASEIFDEMQTDFIPKLVKRYKDEYGANLTVDWQGEQADNAESMSSLFSGSIVALLCMFILLTLEFRSYLQPLIIMSVIPFGWMGAIVGHAVMGLEISLFSFFGMVALTGVIVNDSIVLVDFINHRVRAGIPFLEALTNAGKRRFRPILLTSLTTVAGLLPMLNERSMQAQVLIPMAVSLIFGLMVGTLLILILVPVFYNIYGTMLGWMGVPLIPEDHSDAEPVEKIAA